MADQEFLKPKRGFATAAVHTGIDPEQWSGAVVPPIVTSTMFKKTTSNKGYVYSRSGNPTRAALEQCLAKLEGAKYGIAFASGLGAVTNIMSLLSKGDHLISSDDLYSGTSRLFREIATRLGIEVTFVNCTQATNISNAIQQNTKMVFIETPTNPILQVLDIAGVCQLVKSLGSILVVVDNTFLTPYLQRPLDFGADIVVYSLTKYMNGHSDVVMGAAVFNDDDIAQRLRFLQKAIGAVPSPIDCYLVSRSLKTLALRMEQHKKSSLLIAQWLEKHPKIKEVLHPGLPSHPQYKITVKQTGGHSGIFSFKHCGGLKESEALLNALKLFTLAESLGGFESLAEIPQVNKHGFVTLNQDANRCTIGGRVPRIEDKSVKEVSATNPCVSRQYCLPLNTETEKCHLVRATMTHALVPIEQRLQLGITDELIRLSVGLEDTEDLIEDLEQALDVAFS